MHGTTHLQPATCIDFRRLIFVSLLLLLFLGSSSASIAQNQDSNPQNPANWHYETVHDGEERAIRKEYQLINFLPVAVQTTWQRDWGTLNWTKNGVEVPGLEFFRPFAKSINETDDISYKSQGTRTLRLTWSNSSETAPSTVRIWIRTTARYFHSGPSGYGQCDDGLNGMVVLENDSPEVDAYSNGYALRTLTVNSNGIAETEVLQLAEAYASAGIAQSCGVDAIAGIIWGVDARFVDVRVNGQPVYRASYSSATPDTKYRQYTTMTNWWSHQSHTKAYTYELPKVVPVTVDYGATNTSAVWQLAAPAPRQTKTIDQNGLETLVPQSILPHTFSFTGHASSQNDPAEKHKWNNGGWINGYSIQPFLHNVNPSYFYTLIELTGIFGEIRKEKTVFQERENGGASISFSYRWPDNAELTTMRNVQFVQPVITVHEFEDQEDSNGNGAVTALVESFSMNAEETVTFQPAMFNKQAAVLTTGFGAAGLGVAAAYASPGGPVGIAAAFAAVLALAVQNTPDGMEMETIERDEFDAFFSRWIDQQGVEHRRTPEGFICHPELVPHPSYNHLQFKWAVDVRPFRRMGAKLQEKYGPNGYQSTVFQEDDEWQYLHKAPRLYSFVHPNYSGGGSGGSSGGGSDVPD